MCNKNKMKMVKIDFTKIVVKDIDGNQYMVQEKVGNEIVHVPYDFAKVLGNFLFYKGGDLHISELGQQIYHHKPVEMTVEEFNIVREKINSFFLPFVLLSVNKQLDEIVAAKK